MTKKTRKGFMAAAILLIFQLIFFSCGDEPGEKTTPAIKTPSVEPTGAYSIVISKSGDVSGDTVDASPTAGDAGDIVTLTYNVANTAHYNTLDFSGVTTPIDSVDHAGSGSKTYTINADDASNGVITIIAEFTHTNLELDPISFTDAEGHITKIYGDNFNNAIVSSYKGSGAITYSSSDETVAQVNSSGVVFIKKVGSATISAEKAADAVYAHAQAEYILQVNPRPVTITGLSAVDKVYDGTTTATVSGMENIPELIHGDDVTAVRGTASFEDAEVGDGKTVTFSGWYLTGAAAGNYILSAQPASVTANITAPIPASIMDMVQLTGGTFTIGSPSTELGRYGSTEVQKSITLSAFKINKYQVTQEQYQQVMGTNPSNFKSAVTNESGTPGKLPVENVTWFDAVEFCNKLSEMEGLDKVYTWTSRTPATGYPITNLANITADFNKNGYRLPTDAQWEYACRAGTTTAFNNGNNDYSDADLVKAVAWYDSNSGSKTHQVGQKAPNEWGLYDMHGNVREWCWDWFTNSYTTITTDPTGPASSVSGAGRVNRGGSWDDGNRDLRSACRNDEAPRNKSYEIGFRVVRP